MITGERSNEEIVDFAHTGTKDPHAELPTLDEHDPAGSYEDWRVQILGLAQVEVCSRSTPIGVCGPSRCHRHGIPIRARH